jgi:hypothetical protein
MAWREKISHLSIGCLAIESHWMLWREEKLPPATAAANSLVVHIVASGCVLQQSAGKKSERKGEKIMEQWSRIYNEELHNWYLHLT